MNQPTSNSKTTGRGDLAPAMHAEDEELAVDCTRLSERIDQGLRELEERFAAYVTADSLRRSLGLGKKR